MAVADLRRLAFPGGVDALTETRSRCGNHAALHAGFDLPVLLVAWP